MESLKKNETNKIILVVSYKNIYIYIYICGGQMLLIGFGSSNRSQEQVEYVHACATPSSSPSSSPHRCI